MKIEVLLVLLTAYVDNVLSDFLNEVIDVDDILSENFMPSSLLMLENSVSGGKVANTTNQTKNAPMEALESDGSFGDAMETMNFHRSKMNQYLCRNFLAEQIISNLTVNRIERRLGHVTPGIGEEAVSSSNKLMGVKRSLISDEGSSAYTDWLSKSTTLEDVYRNFDHAQDKDDDDDEDDNGEEQEEVHVPPPASAKGRNPVTLKHRGQGGEEIYYSAGGGGSAYGGHDFGGGGGHSGYGSHSGIGAGQSGYGGGYSVHEPEGHVGYEEGPLPVHQPIYEPSPPKFQVHQVHNYYSKEKDLADLFEVALTALAFLAFKMFLVHVIMCISSVSYQTTTTTTAATVIAMSMNPTATATGGMTGTGGEDGMPGTGGGPNSTGGGDAGTGNGMTGTGDSDGMTGAEGGDSMTGEGEGGTTSTGGGDDGTDNGMTDTGEGNGMTGTGTGTGGETTSTGDTGTGGTGTGDTGTGDTGTGDTGTGDTGSSGDTGEGRYSFKSRMLREVPTTNDADTRALNELARKVLISMDSALIANSDEGECLRKSLCENNKWSRSLEGRGRIFVPVLSLGMSWLSGQLVKTVPWTTSMLDSLKASLFGLGNANCEIIYQKCDLRRRVSDARKKRRRKRSTK